MTEKNIKVPLSGDYPYPTLHIKIDKGNGKFIYCVALYILRGEGAVELCHCDNCHCKGDHIHFFDDSGEEQQKIFNFEGIDKTIEYFKNHWKEYYK